MIDTSLPVSVFINNSTLSFFEIFEPTSAPTGELISPPIIMAISDSGSESVIPVSYTHLTLPTIYSV